MTGLPSLTTKQRFKFNFPKSKYEPRTLKIVTFFCFVADSWWISWTFNAGIYITFSLQGILGFCREEKKGGGYHASWPPLFNWKYIGAGVISRERGVPLYHRAFNFTRQSIFKSRNNAILIPNDLSQEGVSSSPKTISALAIKHRWPGLPVAQTSPLTIWWPQRWYQMPQTTQQDHAQLHSYGRQDNRQGKRPLDNIQTIKSNYLRLTFTLTKTASWTTVMVPLVICKSSAGDTTHIPNPFSTEVHCRNTKSAALHTLSS